MIKTGNKMPLPGQAKPIFDRLKQIGLDIGDYNDIYMSQDAPHDAAAYVTSEDVGPDGLVRIVRFNPNVAKKHLEFSPLRIEQIDSHTKSLVKKEKEFQGDKDKALAESERLLAQIQKEDGDFYQDLQRIIKAFFLFGVTTVHERKHQEGQRPDSGGSFSEFKDEHEAEGVEPAARKKIVDALKADLPMVLLNRPEISGLLSEASHRSINRPFDLVRGLLKVSKILDKKGHFDLSDQIDSFVEEFLNA
jgi:hypothetical protein